MIWFIAAIGHVALLASVVYVAGLTAYLFHLFTD